MLFGKGQSKGEAKQLNTPIVVAVLVVVILGAGFMVFRSLRGSSPAIVPVEGTNVPPQPMTPSPWEVPGGTAPTAQGQQPPPGTAPSPPPAGTPAPAPSSPAQPPSAPGVEKAAQPLNAVQQATPTPTKPAKPLEMRQITVFERVNVSYPANWKIAIGGGNVAAVFTDGKAIFEVHPPDPKASNAKEIAFRAVKSLVGNSPVQAQGQKQISGHEAYWVLVKYGGNVARIVGVDSPTRIVLFEHTTGVPFTAYQSVFDQLEASITFAQ
jgi:hypothetical protein